LTHTSNEIPTFTSSALFVLVVDNRKRASSAQNLISLLFGVFGVKANTIFCTVIFDPDVSFLEARKASFHGKEKRL
jgi:hypothetical protein